MYWLSKGKTEIAALLVAALRIHLHGLSDDFRVVWSEGLLPRLQEGRDITTWDGCCGIDFQREVLPRDCQPPTVLGVAENPPFPDSRGMELKTIFCGSPPGGFRRVGGWVSTVASRSTTTSQRSRLGDPGFVGLVRIKRFHLSSTVPIAVGDRHTVSIATIQAVEERLRVAWRHLVATTQARHRDVIF